MSTRTRSSGRCEYSGMLLGAQLSRPAYSGEIARAQTHLVPAPLIAPAETPPISQRAPLIAQAETPPMSQEASGGPCISLGDAFACVSPTQFERYPLISNEVETV